MYTTIAQAPSSGTLSSWRRGVAVSPVSAAGGRHTLHAYYTANPEHPDGSGVLLFSSGTPEAHEGEILVLQRESGAERVLARGVSTEDSHRAACQQWVRGGREVVYHDVRRVGGREEWVVAGVDAAGGEERLLARGRQLGWGQPHAREVPLYGPHWDPSAHRDLDLLDVESGACRTVLTAEAVRETYPELIREEFGPLADRAGHPLSIFFPALSPDLSRVFFKLAAPLGGHYRSAGASKLRPGGGATPVRRPQVGAPGLAPGFADHPGRPARLDRRHERQPADAAGDSPPPRVAPFLEPGRAPLRL
jgi:hypothetical protein